MLYGFIFLHFICSKKFVQLFIFLLFCNIKLIHIAIAFTYQIPHQQCHHLENTVQILQNTVFVFETAEQNQEKSQIQLYHLASQTGNGFATCPVPLQLFRAAQTKNNQRFLNQ